VSNNCSRKSASLFCFSNDDDDAFDGSIGELQFSYVIITTNNSGYSITTFEVMMQILYWLIISVRLAVTNGISKTASLHCVVFSWLGFLSCESGTDIVPCEFRIVVVESSYNRCFLADINVDLLWYVKATFHY